MNTKQFACTSWTLPHETTTRVGVLVFGTDWYSCVEVKKNILPFILKSGAHPNINNTCRKYV